MNLMRKLLLSLAIVSIAAGPASMAMAATKPAKPATAAAANPKAADCEKQWKAEKKHTQTKKAFLAACEAKA
jgi:Ni/Co efflux regulator RcnB